MCLHVFELLDKRIYVHKIYWCISKKVSSFKITSTLNFISFPVLQVTYIRTKTSKCIFAYLGYWGISIRWNIFVCLFFSFGGRGLSFFNYIVLTLFMLFKLCSLPLQILNLLEVPISYWKQPWNNLDKQISHFRNVYVSSVTIVDKKHIDASVKERPQTPLVPSEEICKPVLCNKHI